MGRYYFRLINMFTSLRGLIDDIRGNPDPAVSSLPLDRLDSVGSLGGLLFNVLTGATFSISLIMFAFGAFRYVVSSGDPKLIEKAYRTMFWSFLAMLVSLIAIVIKRVAIQITGITAPDLVNDRPSF